MNKNTSYIYAEHTSKTLVRIEANAFTLWFADRAQDGWSIVSEQKASDMLDAWDEVWDYPITYDCGKLCGITAQFSIDADWYRNHRLF